MEFEKVLSKYDYADVRIERTVRESVKIMDEEVRVSSGASSCISARVLINNAWGFFSSNSMTTADIGQLLKNAEKLSKIEKANVDIGEPSQEKKTVEREFEAVSSEEKIRSLKDAAKDMRGDEIKGKNASYSESIVESEFYNSAGSEILQKMNYCYVNFSAIAKRKGNIQRAGERQSSIHGFNRLRIYENAQKAKDKALRLLDAELAPKGRFTVIMDNEMTGVFSHEALGHATEADSIIDRESILHGRLGEKIGNDAVTIIDDPAADDFGNCTYDDEGIKSKKTPLVENGVLKNYLNSMETAKKLGLERNGHARAMDASDFPVVRMTNTYFMPGSAGMDDVFGVKHAIYVKGMKGGSVDTFSGGFMFKAEEGYEIINGEKKRLLRDITLTGNVIETLHGVEMTGKDFSTSPGFCGKFGQDVPVSDGGPHIRVSGITVG